MIVKPLEVWQKNLQMPLIQKDILPNQVVAVAYILALLVI